MWYDVLEWVKRVAITSLLIAIGMGVLPGNVENPGVIYNSYLNRGEPVAFGERSATWLKNRGINKASMVIVCECNRSDDPAL